MIKSLSHYAGLQLHLLWNLNW